MQEDSKADFGSSRLTAESRAECKHEQIRTWFTADMREPVGLWSCIACDRKFEPLPDRAQPSSDPPASGGTSPHGLDLTPNELAFVVNELHSQGHGHGSSHDDFEPECPTCTAADKLAARAALKEPT